MKRLSGRLIALLLSPALLLAAVSTILGSSAAKAQDQYLLQPGDQVRLAITELSQSETVATIGMDGMVQLPRFGNFQAAGTTISDLQNSVSAAATGVLVYYYTPAGERVQATLSGTEIFLQVANYRPVYVQGQVARPGPVEFRPGLTARAAITVVGGESTISNLFESSVLTTPGVQSDLEKAVVDHASAVIRLWGLDASIARNAGLKRPEQSQTMVPQEVFDRLLNEQVQQVELNIQTYEVQRAALEERNRVLETRVGLLSQSLSQQEEAVKIEEEDAARIGQLQERGIASAARLSDARQALLLVSTRLLGVQDSLAAFTLQQKEVQEELRTQDTRYRQQFQPARSETLSAIWNAQAEIAGAQKSLAIRGAVASTAGADSEEPTVLVSIIRRDADGSRTIDADLDDLVMPGDVIRVRIEGGMTPFDLPGLAGAAPDAGTVPAAPAP